LSVPVNNAASAITGIRPQCQHTRGNKSADTSM
jgi:hypothetical protein